MAAHGDVEAFLHQVDEAIGDMQPHLHPRVLERQPRQLIGETKLRGRNRRSDVDDAARFREPLVHRALSRVSLDHRRAGMEVEILADIRQHEAARAAMHEPDTKRRLELGHAFAHRRFGAAEPPARGSEPARVHGLDEESAGH